MWVILSPFKMLIYFCSLLATEMLVLTRQASWIKQFVVFILCNKQHFRDNLQKWPMFVSTRSEKKFQMRNLVKEVTHCLETAPNHILSGTVSDMKLEHVSGSEMKLPSFVSKRQHKWAMPNASQEVQTGSMPWEAL